MQNIMNFGWRHLNKYHKGETSKLDEEVHGNRFLNNNFNDKCGATLYGPYDTARGWVFHRNSQSIWFRIQPSEDELMLWAIDSGQLKYC